MADHTPEPWEHLKKHGYAPGDYMSKCHRCGAVQIMDKQATTCRRCAEKLHAAYQSIFASIAKEAEESSEQEAAMADQPEALRLADALENPTIQAPAFRHEVVAELRRLAGVEAERDSMREILDHIPQVEAELEETSDRLHAVEAERDALRDAFRKGFYAGFAATGEGWNGEYPFQDTNRPIAGDPDVEATLDAAIAIAKAEGGGNG